MTSSMVFIDGTVVNVALPALQRDLGATLGDAQWIVEAYELMLAALLLVGGDVAVPRKDGIGRRRDCRVDHLAIAACDTGSSPRA